MSVKSHQERVVLVHSALLRRVSALGERGGAKRVAGAGRLRGVSLLVCKTATHECSEGLCSLRVVYTCIPC